MIISKYRCQQVLTLMQKAAKLATTYGYSSSTGNRSRAAWVLYPTTRCYPVIGAVWCITNIVMTLETMLKAVFSLVILHRCYSDFTYMSTEFDCRCWLCASCWQFSSNEIIREISICLIYWLVILTWDWISLVQAVTIHERVNVYCQLFSHRQFKLCTQLCTMVDQLHGRRQLLVGKV